MFKKTLILVAFLWVCLMTIWFFQNSGLPLGFDHGVYAHLINIIHRDGFTSDLPLYLRYQYEPFSGIFFYNLDAFLGRDILYGWGYFVTYLLTGISIFLLGKNRKHYTYGAIFGLLLFFFSTLQYFNLFWSFGKQIFATFFLILFIKYQKKYLVASIFLAACIALHRLTGFLAVAFLLITFFKSSSKIRPHYIWLFIALFIGISTYLGENFFFQIKPIISQKIEHLFMLSGNYGTGLSKNNFLYFELPSIIVMLFGCIQYARKNRVKTLLSYPIVILFCIIAIMVFLRGIAHTRLQSFFDLFLILILTKFLFEYVKIKWFIILLVIQISLWFSFALKWHKPYITTGENMIIRTITQDMPENVKIFSFTPGYSSWIKRYTRTEVLMPKNNKTGIILAHNSSQLCEHLSTLGENIFIYTGERENIPSVINNPCLKTIQEWNNNSKFLSYSSK